MEKQVSKKVRDAIKAKLLELGVHVDEELPDYIMVLVANRRTKTQMEADLNLFLGDSTKRFVAWLHFVLKKLEEVTAKVKEPTLVSEKLTSSSRKNNGEKEKSSESSKIKLASSPKTKKDKKETKSNKVESISMKMDSRKTVKSDDRSSKKERTVDESSKLIQKKKDKLRKEKTVEASDKEISSPEKNTTKLAPSTVLKFNKTPTSTVQSASAFREDIIADDIQIKKRKRDMKIMVEDLKLDVSESLKSIETSKSNDSIGPGGLSQQKITDPHNFPPTSKKDSSSIHDQVTDNKTIKECENSQEGEEDQDYLTLKADPIESDEYLMEGNNKIDKVRIVHQKSRPILSVNSEKEPDLSKSRSFKANKELSAVDKISSSSLRKDTDFYEKSKEIEVAKTTKVNTRHIRDAILHHCSTDESKESIHKLNRKSSKRIFNEYEDDQSRKKRKSFSPVRPPFARHKSKSRSPSDSKRTEIKTPRKEVFCDSSSSSHLQSRESRPKVLKSSIGAVVSRKRDDSDYESNDEKVSKVPSVVKVTSRPKREVDATKKLLMIAVADANKSIIQSHRTLESESPIKVSEPSASLYDTNIVRVLESGVKRKHQLCSKIEKNLSPSKKPSIKDRLGMPLRSHRITLSEEGSVPRRSVKERLGVHHLPLSEPALDRKMDFEDADDDLQTIVINVENTSYYDSNPSKQETNHTFDSQVPRNRRGMVHAEDANATRERISIQVNMSDSEEEQIETEDEEHKESDADVIMSGVDYNAPKEVENSDADEELAISINDTDNDGSLLPPSEEKSMESVESNHSDFETTGSIDKSSVREETPEANKKVNSHNAGPLSFTNSIHSSSEEGKNSRSVHRDTREGESSNNRAKFVITINNEEDHGTDDEGGASCMPFSHEDLRHKLSNPKKPLTVVTAEAESSDTNVTSSSMNMMEQAMYSNNMIVGASMIPAKTQCKYWPECTFGDKCKYLHPGCKFGANCTNPKCAYKHPAGRDVALSAKFKPNASGGGDSRMRCKYFPKCTSLSCKFYHPSPCRFGLGCNNPQCEQYHPSMTDSSIKKATDKLSNQNQFKWVKMFS